MLIATPLVLIYAIHCLRAAPDRRPAVIALVIAAVEAVVVGWHAFTLLSL